MKRIFVAFLLTTILLFTGAVCTNQNGNNDSGVVKTDIVVISDSGFKPESLTVSKNTAVQWINEGDKQHQIVSDGDIRELQSGILEKGNNFTFVFENSGAWKYHCNIHPEIKGEIVVR